MRKLVNVLGVNIDCLDEGRVVERLSEWARRPESRYVCICNVHSLVTAHESPEFSEVLNSADLATPDGAPVAWLMRSGGVKEQRRVSGPDVMEQYCKLAAANGSSIFLYESTDEVLDSLKLNLERKYPGLVVAGRFSPPFRPLSDAESEVVVKMINDSGATTVWVGLGCPKQELWMAAHRGKIQAVMVGVGAAFEFLSGHRTRAPKWIGRIGFEWLFRLICEPRRLWRRYLVSNAKFSMLLCGGVGRANVKVLSAPE